MNNKLTMLVMGMSAAGIGCTPPEDADVACADREVTVNHEPAYLEAIPEHVRKICPGDTLTVMLVPALDPGFARTEPDRESRDGAPWLEGRNSEGDRIVLAVPEDAEEGTFKYSISVEGVGTLDPRVTVARH